MAEVGGLAKMMVWSMTLLENQLAEKLWVLKVLQHLSTSGLYSVISEYFKASYFCFRLTMSRPSHINPFSPVLSEVNCTSMMEARAAREICAHLNDPDPSGQLLFRSSEILWNLLEKSSKEEIIQQLSNLECLL